MSNCNIKSKKHFQTLNPNLKMNLRFNLLSKGMAALLTGQLIISCNTDKTAEQQPNIIMFLADDQGWGDLSLHGNPNLNTPHINSIAENGARFSHFYVCPVCSPTRAELLTGRYHPRAGVYSTSAGGERMDLDETTLADILKKAGYKTAAFGKWHNGMQYPYHPNARGFDEFYGFCSGHWGHYFSPMLEHNGKLIKGEGYIIDDLTTKAIDYISKYKNAPFFVYLPYNVPHSPMQAPERNRNKFENTSLIKRHFEPEKEDTMHTKAALAMCENIDENVGRILRHIKDLNLEKNTIVMYLSDNGPNGWRWNGGMRGKKGWVDEGGVRSPFFIQWTENIKPGTIIEGIAGAIDILPTITDLIGIKSSTGKTSDGISLRSALMDSDKQTPDRKIVNYWHGKISIRSQQFRLDNENRLYDIKNDPGQVKDISAEFPDVTKEHMSYKKNWKKNVLSELPEHDKRRFPVGHPDFVYNQLPARDGVPHGDIRRSNKYPNCSFFTNWTSVSDSITWDIEVLSAGRFEAIIYYTCAPENTGSVIQLQFKNDSVNNKLNMPHDSELIGAEHDIVPRQESYVKDFVPFSVGIINLEKGKGKLVLKATEIPGKQVMDFRLIMLKRH
jgi:arylsulfatase A-like enzyme